MQAGWLFYGIGAIDLLISPDISHLFLTEAELSETWIQIFSGSKIHKAIEIYTPNIFKYLINPKYV